MPKSFKCSDVGIDCGWTATAESEEDMMNKIREHAKEHGMQEIPSDVLEKVKTSIKEA